MKTNYKLQGSPNSPVIVFSNSLGATMQMWDDLVPYLLPYFRVLQYDTRGHGSSEITKGPYSIELLGKDLLELLDRLEIEKVYFCGLSMGGLIGQWLGLNYPERIKKLIISNTDAKIGTIESWNERISTILGNGMVSILEGTMSKWFTDDFRNNCKEKTEGIKKMFLANDITGYTACCAAVGGADFRSELKNIKPETLIIAGDEDPVTNVQQAQKMAGEIPNCRLVVLHARHLASTEIPEEYAGLLIDFIVGNTTLDKGMHIRRIVLGDAHVDRAIEMKNDFNRDFQEFISNYAWGEIWTRPGLTKQNRSLITIAMLIALNRKAEFKMHLKAALNNGISITEIREVIMHSGIYCGLPAANEAIHTAEEIFAELGLKLN